MDKMILQEVMPINVERITRTVKNDPISNVLMGSLLLNNKSHSVYLKFYPIQLGNRGLLNEIIGYLYGTVSNISQPEFAGVAFVPTDMLKPFYKALTEDLKESAKEEAYLPAFFTESVLGHHYKYNILTDKQRKQILKWPDFNKAVVFDEIIANTDRYPRNLIQTGINHFCLIDNGFLATENNSYPNWKSSQLYPERNYENQLALINQAEIQADARKGNRIIAAADEYFLSYNHLLPEIEYWIDLLIEDNEKQDWLAFLDFLECRTKGINSLLSNRYGLLG